MPVIEMPKKPEPEPEPEPKEKTSTPLPEQPTRPLIPELEVKDVSSDEELIIAEVEDKEEDVFKQRPAPRMAPVEQLSEEPPAPPPAPPDEFAPKAKRKYTRKAPMSIKQTEHLAKIRAIATEKRKATKALKEKSKEDALVAKAEAKIINDQNRRKQVLAQEAGLQRDLEREKEAQTQQYSKPKPSALSEHSFSKADLDSAVLSAITSYDQLRKKQKAEDKEQKIKDQNENNMKRTIQQAIQPQTVPSDPWRNYFT